jgi:hypothetical protein
MRFFSSIRVPGLGRLSPRIGVIGDRVRSGAAVRSAWFWIGFFGVIATAWWLVSHAH